MPRAGFRVSTTGRVPSSHFKLAAEGPYPRACLVLSLSSALGGWGDALFVAISGGTDEGQVVRYAVTPMSEAAGGEASSSAAR